MGEKAKTVEKTVKKEVKDVKDSQEATAELRFTGKEHEINH